MKKSIKNRLVQLEASLKEARELMRQRREAQKEYQKYYRSPNFARKREWISSSAAPRRPSDR